MICFSAVGRAREHRGDRDRDQRDIGRSADDEFGIVEPVAEQRDQQAELQDQDREREADPGGQLDQQLMAEASGRPFQIVADDRNAAEHGVAADAEQRPADLLALLAGLGLPQAAQQRQDGEDHEADEEGLVQRSVQEHEDRQRGDQPDPAPRQIAVRKQQDPRQQQDVAEVVHGNVEPARHADRAPGRPTTVARRRSSAARPARAPS